VGVTFPIDPLIHHMTQSSPDIEIRNVEVITDQQRVSHAENDIYRRM